MRPVLYDGRVKNPLAANLSMPRQKESRQRCNRSDFDSLDRDDIARPG